MQPRFSLENRAEDNHANVCFYKSFQAIWKLLLNCFNEMENVVCWQFWQIKPISNRFFFVFLKMVTEAFHRFEKREKLLHDEEKNRLFSRNFCKIIVISNGVWGISRKISSKKSASISRKNLKIQCHCQYYFNQFCNAFLNLKLRVKQRIVHKYRSKNN